MHRSLATLALSVFVLTGAALGLAARDRGNVGAAVVSAGDAASGPASAVAQSKGRYKKQGDLCVWDAEDTGPAQCTPIIEGRFKKTGDACTWDANDRGPDQCRPRSGRFKQEEDRCVWNGSDSGPDQCNPRKPR